MSLKVQSSFASGELDPILQERTTLAKFKAGLATARNVVVGRTGNIISRPGRSHLFATKLDNKKVKVYCPPRTGYMMEWGDGYVRIYKNYVLQFDVAQSFTEADLPNLHFETNGLFVYVFCLGKLTKKVNYTTGIFKAGITEVFALPPLAQGITVTAAGAPTGYFVDYAVTYVINGEESPYIWLAGGAVVKLPIAAGQSNSVDGKLTLTVIFGITEMRVYRRPVSGGAFGFVGSTTSFTVVGTEVHGTFLDIGAQADYTHQPPDLLAPLHPGIYDLMSPTGVVYQQRLVIGEWADREAIYASRPGYQNNFSKESPLSSDSALAFKAATSGTAQLLRMIESDGLVVFTSAGIFVNTGQLSPENLSLDRKGKWVIDVRIQPLAVPGGVFFVDVTTNTIRSLTWSTELAGYNAEDISIYSGHLFRRNLITSWAFQEGVLPVLWVTFDDGTFASFTYQFDQEMRAWTRHDSDPNLFIEQVAESGISETTYFVCKQGTKRYIEVTIPRYIPVSFLAADAQADKNPSIAAMDSVRSYNGKLSALTGGDTFQLTPVDADVWDGNLTLTCGTSGIFTDPGTPEVPPGPGTPGVTLRYFNDDDRTSIDLKVISRNSNNSIVVRPSISFADEDVTSFTSLYFCVDFFGGLTDLEGEYPSVIVDGNVIYSPKNDDQNYNGSDPDNLSGQVVGGNIFLPVGVKAAMAHIGRGYVMDIETLEIDTVEQKPTVVESSTIDKLYIKTHESSEVYVGQKFPKDDKVKGLNRIDSYDVDYSEDDPIIGNRYKQPNTVRREVTMSGDWEANGKIAMRQVDPLHFEILSVIPDCEIYWRSDR